MASTPQRPQSQTQGSQARTEPERPSPPPVRPGPQPDLQHQAERDAAEKEKREKEAKEEKVLEEEDAKALFRGGHRLKKKGDPPEKWFAGVRVHNVLCICKPVDEEVEKTVLAEELVLVPD